MAITLNGTTGITTPDLTSDGSLKIDASAPDDSLVVDASGNVGIGTSSPSDAQLDVRGTAGVKIGDGTCTLELLGRNDLGYAIIGTDTNHPLAIRTNNTERARIDSSGNLLVGTTSAVANVGGLSVDATGSLHCASFQAGSNGYGIVLRNSGGTTVGSIGMGASSTSYNTTSDYRLKENVVGVTGASARVQQLNPVRFNFIADPDTTVDGFLAHEVQDVVPEAITGTKDAVDAEGNPEYQGIDQSKLVPLLTAALQEALGKIETLEARVAALEAA